MSECRNVKNKQLKQKVRAEKRDKIHVVRRVD